MHMHCRDCGLLCAGEHESLCAFCRTRNRFWFILDELPVSLRGWAINSLRIWTSIQREINIKNTSAYKKKRARQLPLRRKARLQQFLLVRGERSQQKAKSAQTRRGWSLSVRRTRQKVQSRRRKVQQRRKKKASIPVPRRAIIETEISRKEEK